MLKARAAIVGSAACVVLPLRSAAAESAGATAAQTAKECPCFGSHAGIGQFNLSVALFAGIALCICVWLLFSWIDATLNRPKPASEEVTRRSIAISARIITALGFLGAAGHALFVPIETGARWIPALDTTTIAWIAIAALGALIPFLSEFTVAGVSVKLREAEQTTKGVLGDATNLARRWLEQTSSLLRDKPTSLGANADAWPDTVKRFIGGPCDEALRWVGGPEEKRRLSLWLLKDGNTKLQFWFSNQRFDSAELADFAVTEGLIGKTARRQEPLRLADATKEPEFLARAGSSDFHGLYCTPITRKSEGHADRAIGVLVVDRQKSQVVNDNAADVLEALSAMIALLLDPS
jgi:hypothetical protein